ncbi:uncharacterized protein TNCV_2356431 [Trichonephila clavipes]|nr:uncharacterized protein TNCV_2356431 [Trichonephila clavipes]
MGKNGDLSPCKKAEVKVLVNAKLFSNRETSRRLKNSEASVRRIKKKIESGEELSPKRKKKCGRKPIFTPILKRSLKKFCLENRFATTKVIKAQLQDINVNASESTVRRKLKDLNFKTYRPARKHMLTPAMKAKRLNWAKQWRDKDVDFWRSICCYNLFTNEVCFSDVSTYEILQNKAQLVRRRHGEKFLSDCKTPYKNNDLVSHQRQGWKNGFQMEETYIFMQDGAPCHIDRSIKAFLAEQNTPLLDWPGNSPDMNAIENVWEVMKREVAKDVITNKTQFLERIIHVWNHHPQM